MRSPDFDSNQYPNRPAGTMQGRSAAVLKSDALREGAPEWVLAVRTESL
jgi:hypothetical protein